jgi:hypothetical protein
MRLLARCSLSCFLRSSSCVPLHSLLALDEILQPSIANMLRPIAVDKERQQTFYWFDLKEIPLVNFYKADLDFIEMYLAKYT